MASDMVLLEKNEAIIERKLDNVQHELDEILHDAEAEFTEEELERARVHLKGLGFKLILIPLTHPLTFAKTLFQLGYEPYFLTFGKEYIWFGRNVHFLPNAFTYLRNVYNSHGLKAIYAGLDANLLSSVTSSLAGFAAATYLDHYYPKVGGYPINLGKEESELTHHQSLRLAVRQAIRDSIAVTFGVIVSQPFTVIMVREIAQHIGGENKYPNVLTSILRIGYEEGPSGYFSGLIPNLLSGYVTILAMAGIRYGAERLIKHVEEQTDPTDETTIRATRDIKYVIKYALPFLVSSLSYPLTVVSTVMAVNGSGLAVSLYSPAFSHWSEAHSFLKPFGLARGNRLFLRKQYGPVSVGNDRHVYASNKNFV